MGFHEDGCRSAVERPRRTESPDDHDRTSTAGASVVGSVRHGRSGQVRDARPGTGSTDGGSSTGRVHPSQETLSMGGRTSPHPHPSVPGLA